MQLNGNTKLQNSEDRASVLAQAALGNEAASDAVKSNNKNFR